MKIPSTRWRARLRASRQWEAPRSFIAPASFWRVDFRAAELLQIAQHLMTWGPTVTILAPDDLKAIMWEEIEALHAHHRPVKKKSRAK